MNKTAKKRKDDDLFNSSSMSFGEHLMELRRCLIYAVLWLTGGFLIALLPLGSTPSLASRAVAYVQRPLKRSLESFYVAQSGKELTRNQAKLEKYDYPSEVASIPSRYHMTPRQFWVFPGDRKRLESVFPGMIPDASRDAAAAASPTSVEGDWSGEPQLIILWEKLEGDSRLRTKALNMPETFVIFVKAALLVGLVIASPGVFYNFWTFIAAGLHPNERKLVYRFLPASIILFLGGFCLAFFVVFEMVLSFLLRFNAGMNIDPDPRISEWLNFSLLLPIGFGIAFQLPLVMFGMYRLRIFRIQDYIRRWKLAIFVIAFLSMMLTPPDPGSMICMMTPLIGLYFGGILMCRMFPVQELPGYDEDEDDTADKPKTKVAKTEKNENKK
ncbi:MAG: twin-arginine translocase subunit TatC [Planctomycetia bacterium]|nr:twin-arginine translocase subunit TatC [Planctomycetia bacterium]